ncbi:MAG: hypothetical protein AABY22_12775 [Nanoarchaeota archaeon]
MGKSYDRHHIAMKFTGHHNPRTFCRYCVEENPSANLKFISPESIEKPIENKEQKN